MNTKSRETSQKPAFAIRVHLADGSVESFAPASEAEAKKLWDQIEPSHLFAQSRLVLAGEHSKSVFVTAHVLRVDFIQDTYECWQFPGGYSDVVELSEEDFRKRAHLDQPELMARREQPTPVGDLLVSFLKLHIAGAKPLFLMIEFPVKLPAENQSFMQFMLSKAGLHMRLRGGGFGVVNLAHLAGYTVYPGVAQVPVDTWFAEPLPNETLP
ncbi:MAG: hypothetical protein ABSH48_02810 [Verrucomicrobiota bacterium]|jgi:hypothetical protein